ncbi:MAG: hypothetical protein ACKVHP_20885, partial [Verrucomicrobiales bacterium]
GKWLGQLKNDQDRWSAIAVFAQEAVTLDPLAAFTWIDTVTDPAIRRGFEMRLFDHWLEKDREGMVHAIEEVEWPGDRRKVLSDLLAASPL